MVLVLLAVAIWTPLNIVTTWFGLLAAVSIVVATVVAFSWACRNELAPVIREADPQPAPQ